MKKGKMKKETTKSSDKLTKYWNEYLYKKYFLATYAENDFSPKPVLVSSTSLTSPHPTQPPPHTCPTPLLLYLLFRFLTINLFLDVWSPASRLVLLLLLLLVWGHVIRVCAFQPSRIPSQVSCRCARCRLRSGNCFNLF